MGTYLTFDIPDRRTLCINAGSARTIARELFSPPGSGPKVSGLTDVSPIIIIQERLR